MKQLHVVLLDFPAIKHFVFGTDRLVEIRGASALVDELNRVMIPDWLKNRFGPERCRCVFVGGGAGQFMIDDTPQTIQAAVAGVQGEIMAQTGGALRLAVGVAPLGNDYAQSLTHAFYDLKKNKNENPFIPCSSVHTGFMQECESCSGMATTVSRYAGAARYLCETCHIKETTGQQRGLWRELAASLSRNGGDAQLIEKQRPLHFEEIGDRCIARRGYTALIYGDGDHIGQLVKQINSEERYQRFSKAVDESVREACHEAMRLHCPPVKGKIPGDMLLLGGDDLMVYLSAETALPFALEVIRLFNRNIYQKLIAQNPDPFCIYNQQFSFWKKLKQKIVFQLFW